MTHAPQLYDFRSGNPLLGRGDESCTTPEQELKQMIVDDSRNTLTFVTVTLHFMC